MAWFPFLKNKQDAAPSEPVVSASETAAPAPPPASPTQATPPSAHPLHAGDILRIATNPPSGGVARRSSTPETVEVFDEFGRTLQIKTEDFRTNVLPGGLKMHWNNPEGLYGNILQGLQLNMAPDVLTAARHLHGIDPIPERGSVMLSIVLRATDQPAEAESVLLQHIQQHGPSAVVLTNLAKAQFDLGRPSESEATLWHAIELDPNLDNGVEWYAAQLRDRDGPAAWDEAMQRIAALPQSWLAQVWLARSALQRDDIPGALTLYQHALAHAPRPAPATLLQNMTGDLGKKGLFTQALQLAAPLYDPAVHGLPVGNNLIKLALETGNYEGANAYLQGLLQQNRLNWKSTLLYWETEIRQRQLAAQPPASVPVQLLNYNLDGPIWLQPQSSARPLFAGEAARSSSRVVFFVSTITSETGIAPLQAHMADRTGRLSRMWPLFAAEQAFMRLHCEASVCVPYVEGGGGFAMFPNPITDEEALNFAHQLQATCAVTAHLTSAGETATLSVRLIRMGADNTPSLIEELQGTYSWLNVHAGLLTLSEQVTTLLQQHFHSPENAAPARYTLPSLSQLGLYQLRLEQLLAVVCASAESGRGLSGEREMVRGMLDLSLDAPGCLPIRLVLHETLRRFQTTHPEIVSEFRDPVTRLETKYPLPDLEADALLKQQLQQLYPETATT